MAISIYIHSSIHQSIHLSVRPSVRLSIHLSLHRHFLLLQCCPSCLPIKKVLIFYLSGLTNKNCLLLSNTNKIPQLHQALRQSQTQKWWEVSESLCHSPQSWLVLLGWWEDQGPKWLPEDTNGSSLSTLGALAAPDCCHSLPCFSE